MCRIVGTVFLVFVVVTNFDRPCFGHEGGETFGSISDVGTYRVFTDFSRLNLVIGKDIDYVVVNAVGNHTHTKIASTTLNITRPFQSVSSTFSFTYSTPIRETDHNPIPRGTTYGDCVPIKIRASSLGNTRFGVSSGTSQSVDGQMFNHRIVVFTDVQLEVRKPGDMNGDNQVNMDDYLAFAAAFDAGAQKVGYEGGDFNLDGTVDFVDFLILANGFGT